METKQKQILWGVVAAVIVVVLVFVFSGGGSDSDSGSQTTDQAELVQPAEEQRIIQQTDEQVLADFPEGFPVEEGAQNTNSFKFIPANSLEEQSTMSYTSQRTLDENAIIFKSFMDENGFEIINEETDEDFRFFYATKDGNDLSVTIEELVGQVQVSVSYLQR